MSRHVTDVTLGLLSLLSHNDHLAVNNPYFSDCNHSFTSSECDTRCLSRPDNNNCNDFASTVASRNSVVADKDKTLISEPDTSCCSQNTQNKKDGNNLVSKLISPPSLLDESKHPIFVSKISSDLSPPPPHLLGEKARAPAHKRVVQSTNMVVGGHTAEGPVDLEVKIILLGDYSVGKSSLLRVLARHSSQFSDRDDYASSVVNSSTRSWSSLRGDQRLAYTDTGSRAALVRSSLQPGGFVEVEFTHQDKSVLARIADTGGQERYRSMTTSYYRGAHGCLLMFDVTKEESFSGLDTWIENMDCYKSIDVFPCILVGTRCKSLARRVPYERAAEFADNRGLPYMELDMDHMTDVRRVFEALLDNVTVNLNKPEPIAISIRPEISGKNVRLRNSVACSC